MVVRVRYERKAAPPPAAGGRNFLTDLALLAQQQRGRGGAGPGVPRTGRGGAARPGVPSNGLTPEEARQRAIRGWVTRRGGAPVAKPAKKGKGGGGGGKGGGGAKSKDAARQAILDAFTGIAGVGKTDITASLVGNKGLAQYLSTGGGDLGMPTDPEDPGQKARALAHTLLNEQMQGLPASVRSAVLAAARAAGPNNNDVGFAIAAALTNAATSGAPASTAYKNAYTVATKMADAQNPKLLGDLRKIVNSTGDPKTREALSKALEAGNDPVVAHAMAYVAVTSARMWKSPDDIAKAIQSAKDNAAQFVSNAGDYMKGGAPLYATAQDRQRAERQAQRDADKAKRDVEMAAKKAARDAEIAARKAKRDAEIAARKAQQEAAQREAASQSVAMPYRPTVIYYGGKSLQSKRGGPLPGTRAASERTRRAWATRRLHSPRVLGTLARRAATEGGFTYDPATGRFPDRGIAVAVPGNEFAIDLNNFTPESLASYLTKERIQALRDDPRLHLGGWYDAGHGEIVLDQVELFPEAEREQAIVAGRNRNQQAIFDLGGGLEIPTGGTGETHGEGKVRFNGAEGKAGVPDQAPGGRVGRRVPRPPTRLAPRVRSAPAQGRPGQADRGVRRTATRPVGPSSSGGMAIRETPEFLTDSVAAWFAATADEPEGKAGGPAAGSAAAHLRTVHAWERRRRGMDANLFTRHARLSSALAGQGGGEPLAEVPPGTSFTRVLPSEFELQDRFGSTPDSVKAALQRQFPRAIVAIYPPKSMDEARYMRRLRGIAAGLVDASEGHDTVNQSISFLSFAPRPPATPAETDTGADGIHIAFDPEGIYSGSMVAPTVVASYEQKTGMLAYGAGVHEYGHAIDFHYVAAQGKDWTRTALFRYALIGKVHGDILQWTPAEREMLREAAPSPYGATNPIEANAEMFAADFLGLNAPGYNPNATLHRKWHQRVAAADKTPSYWQNVKEAAVMLERKDAPTHHSPNPNARRLRKYWTRGEGAAKIRWNTPNDWYRCVRHLSKYIVDAKGYCSQIHKDATGVWPGDRRNVGGNGRGKSLAPPCIGCKDKAAPGAPPSRVTMAVGPGLYVQRKDVYTSAPKGAIPQGLAPVTRGVPVKRKRRYRVRTRRLFGGTEGKSGGPAAGSAAAHLRTVRAWESRRRHLRASPEALEQRYRMLDQITAHGEYAMGGPHDTYVKYRNSKGIWSPERRKLQKKIEAHLLNMAVERGVPAERKALITGGLPGAGKTTALNTATVQDHLDVNPDEYMEINADIIKEILFKLGAVETIPGLTPAESAHLVHKESSLVAHELVRLAMNQGLNIIWDNTFGGPPVVLPDLRRNGYETAGLFVDVSPNASKASVIRRYAQGMADYANGQGVGGRFVPFHVIDHYGKVPAKAEMPEGKPRSMNRVYFQRAIEQGLFDRAVVVDNEHHQEQVVYTL